MCPAEKGDFSTVHQVASSPLETAKRFEEAGARWVHMVDLDGARDGVRQNFPLINQVIQNSNLKVDLGGGIKHERDVTAVAEAGVGQLGHWICGSEQPKLVDYALERYGRNG